MFSLRQPVIAHAPSQAAISKARSQHGVHIYFDEPHTEKNKKFDTPLANMESTRSPNLTWTSLFRAKGGNASFALRLGHRPDSVALEYGIAGGTTYYAARRDSAKKWAQENFFDESLTKGKYAVLTMHCKYPQGGKVKDIKFEANGKAQTKTLKFDDSKWYYQLGSSLSQHSTNFSNTELLETHFIYTGITQGLPPRAPGTDYHSFQTSTLTHITQGNTAVIQGQYVASNKKYKGIVIGLGAAKKSPALYDFQSYQGGSANVTFRVSVGFRDVAISSNKEQKVLDIEIGPDDKAWLLFENINISNLEIHTTAKIET